jgi:hypothetical protein
VKIVGQFVHGKWFCSEACSLKDPETQKLQEMLEKGIEFKNDEVGDGEDEDYAKDEDIDL